LQISHAHQTCIESVGENLPEEGPGMPFEGKKDLFSSEILHVFHMLRGPSSVILYERALTGQRLFLSFLGLPVTSRSGLGGPAMVKMW
jgi:hypothetical protein